MWSKAYVGNFFIEKITQTRSGDFFICGYTGGRHGYIDSEGYVTKLNKEGSLMWSKKIGGKFVYDVIELSDNRLAFLKENSNKDKTECFLEVTDANGAEKWTSALMQNPMMSYTGSGKLMVGYRKVFPDTGYDIVLKCMDTNGHTEWAHRYGGTGDEDLYGIFEIPNVGYYLIGQTAEYTGIGYYRFNSFENTNTWVNYSVLKNYVVKTDLQGITCK
jgi:hypothetical protein